MSMRLEKAKLPPPPGLIAALSAGFDATASHVAIIIPPVLLDLFLWLGPHLRLTRLMQPVLGNFSQLSLPQSSSIPDTGMLQQFWADFLNRFNLLGLLRTYPIGITSLMSSSMPGETPLGMPLNWQIPSFSSFLISWLLLVVAGWFLGGFYIYQVANRSLALETPQSFKQTIVQSLFLSLVWFLLAALAFIPMLLFFSFLMLISPTLAQVGMFIFLMVAVWLISPIYFSPHGIFTYGHNALASIQQSLRMLRISLPTIGIFLLICLLINEGLNYLWRLPPENSWLTLVGIGGHAFISTSLLAASFIYYRNINAWLKTVLEHLNTKKSPA